MDQDGTGGDPTPVRVIQIGDRESDLRMPAVDEHAACGPLVHWWPCHGHRLVTDTKPLRDSATRSTSSRSPQRWPCDDHRTFGFILANK